MDLKKIAALRATVATLPDSLPIVWFFRIPGWHSSGVTMTQVIANVPDYPYAAHDADDRLDTSTALVSYWLGVSEHVATALFDVEQWSYVDTAAVDAHLDNEGEYIRATARIARAAGVLDKHAIQRDHMLAILDAILDGSLTFERSDEL